MTRWSARQELNISSPISKGWRGPYSDESFGPRVPATAQPSHGWRCSRIDKGGISVKPDVSFMRVTAPAARHIADRPDPIKFRNEPLKV